MEDLGQLDVKREAYRVSEVAKLFGVNVVTVYRKIYGGELKVLNSFGRIMIPRAEIQKLIAKPVVYTPRMKPKANIRK